MPNADYRFSIASDIVAAPLFCYAGFMNGNRTRVILYGDTLLLEGVQVNLKALTDLEVLDLPLETPLEELQRLCPAVVVFDLEATRPDFLFPLLQQPGLLLVGINPETHRALAWSGRHAPAVSAADLFEIIQQKET
jgi:hypothetical protein